MKYIYYTSNCSWATSVRLLHSWAGTLRTKSLQHTATHCNTLQHTATHCNTLQHTTTHCQTHCNTHRILLNSTLRTKSIPKPINFCARLWNAVTKIYVIPPSPPLPFSLQPLPLSPFLHLQIFFSSLSLSLSTPPLTSFSLRSSRFLRSRK